MPSLFRSEEMVLCQLFMQPEAAYGCIAELGELGLVQFIDLNPSVNNFQRKFVNEVRRCDEMERKLRFLEKEIKADEIAIIDNGEIPPVPVPRELVDLENTFEKLEYDVKEVKSNAAVLKKNFLELTEMNQTLDKTKAFFSANDPSYINEDHHEDLHKDDRPATGMVQLNFLTGVIAKERLLGFERMLWRVCRGNEFFKTIEIENALEDPTTGEEKKKVVFILYFQGDHLKVKVKKICEGYKATIYPCPENVVERLEMALSVQKRMEDLKTVIQQTTEHRKNVLKTAAKDIRVWLLKVRKVKAIYHTLNLFSLDHSQKSLVGECWCPVADLKNIQAALEDGAAKFGSSIPPLLNRMETFQQPPSFHRHNKFSIVFQDIVDSYAVSSYREVNPALYTTISFPFLFSVMFGDAGHGLIMFLFALFMVVKEKHFLAQKSTNEIWNMFFGGRYIILLMGAFSIYSGFLYNDIFSKSCNIFQSAWSAKRFSAEYLSVNTDITLNPNLPKWNITFDYSGHPYTIGMDPVWQLATNKITFLNSYKMKISIVFGVIHMIFGVLLCIFNFGYRRDYIGLFGEFLPEIIFLVFLFGYLVALIIYKWIAFDASQSFMAPSLLIHFINMFMMSYYKAEDTQAPTGATIFYKNQQAFQTFLVIGALLTVPVLLLVRPFCMRRKHRMSENVHRLGDRVSLNNNEETQPHFDTIQQEIHEPHEEEEEFEFGEAFVHQAIHTIEYCLGCISHTASYLRLWALSLAHAELSEVLWNMVLHIGLNMGGYMGVIALFLVFAPWACLTVGILLLMEGLSAFLHTIRLHWIEFQSKFYKGEGYKFMPFSFKHIDEEAEEDTA